MSNQAQRTILNSQANLAQRPPPISPLRAELTYRQLRRMVRAVHILHRLSRNSAYQSLLTDKLPATAQFDCGYGSVMMGYDFHLGASGPKLIEVNTDAGGIWYAQLCYDPHAAGFSERLGRRLLKTFIHEFALFSGNPLARPKRIAIVDEQPLEQPLYWEMQVFAALFRQAGIEATIDDPEALELTAGGLYIGDKRIDMIYNRHCDFYLQTAAMQKIKHAWLNALVCLSPNPRTYGLLADKQRMILWPQREIMAEVGLTGSDLAILVDTIAETRLLESLASEVAWRTRKQWVFKPDTGHASRSVYVGAKITKTKFATLNAHNTVLQQHIPPSLSRGANNEVFKTDYRLFAYRNQVLTVCARLYQGQVTNLHTPNGGFAQVRLVTSAI